MNHVSATIGTRAVDPRILADDKFLKRMSNFDRVCKQIDAKHDHVMEMLATIQEQLRNLEMKQRKERGAQFQSQTTAIKPPYLSMSRPQEIEVESKILPPNQRLSSLSYGSNDAKLEIEGFVEVLKPASIISTVAVETVSPTKNSTKIHERMVFDEMPKSGKSKISGILPPLVLGSESAEVCDFSVSNSQFQTPLECLSLIPSPSSFNFSLGGTKLEDEGLVEVPIHTIAVESQLQEPESEFERSRNFPILSLPKFVPSWRIMVSSLLHLPFLYKCNSVEVLTKEKLIWLDTGQYLIVSGLSRESVTSNFIVSWKWLDEMYQDKNILVSGMKLNGFQLDLSIIGVVLGVNPRRIAHFQLSEMVVNDLCSSIVNSHDHGIAGWFLNDSWGDVLTLEVNELIRAAHEKQLKAVSRRTMMESSESRVKQVLYKLRDDVGSGARKILAGSNNLIAMFTGGYKGSFNNISQIAMSNGSICSFVSQNNQLKNVFVFHKSLVNPTVGLEDVIPLQEINSLHTAEGDQVDQDQVPALKKFGLAKFHSTANGFGNDPLHCFKVYFKPNKLLLNCEINTVVHSWSICHQDMFPNSAGFVITDGCLYQCLISLIRVDSTKYSDIEHYIHECGGVGRFRKTVGHYKEKKNLEVTLVFDPGDLDFFSLNIEDNSVEVVILGGISIAFSSWYIVSGFYFYYQGSESNHYNYHSLKDVNVQQNCVAAFVGEAVEFEVVSIEVVTWGKKVGGSECPENQRNESGGLIASLWTLEINFELIVFELVVVATECQIFEAKLQVKTTTKSSLELDLTNEKQRLNCRLVLEDGFVCAAVFEAYGCPSKMFDRPPLKPPFQSRHLSLEDKTHSRGEYCHVHGYGEKRWSLWGNWDSIPNLIWGIDSADSGRRKECGYFCYGL